MEEYDNIDPFKLPKLDIGFKTGIYFLYKEDTLVYIGQTRNLMGRLGTHLAEKLKDFDSYVFIPIEDVSNIYNIETFFIQKYTPIYNIGSTLKGYTKKEVDTFNFINILNYEEEAK